MVDGSAQQHHRTRYADANRKHGLAPRRNLHGHRDPSLLALRGGGEDSAGHLYCDSSCRSSGQAGKVARGLSPGPVYLTAPPGDRRLFVAGLDGKIWIVQQGQTVPSVFLDLGPKVRLGTYTGLFSLAFHPNYASNGYFYVYYVNRDGDIQLERYRVSADPNQAEPASAKPILTIKPTGPGPDIHYGGQLNFGPDGKMHIAVGDGGLPASAQDKASLLGKLLRIDVDAGDPCAVPAGNPFAGQAGARGEIWILGLRNPWRWSIDHQTGLVFIGDPGADHWEEVNAEAQCAPHWARARVWRNRPS